MRVWYRLLADFIWVLHFCVVALVLFGWLVPPVQLLYVGALLSVLVSNITLHYCFLSKWEFVLRKKVDPQLAYDFAYTSYYTYRLTKGYVSTGFLRWAGLGYAASALLIQLTLYLYLIPCV